MVDNSYTYGVGGGMVCEKARGQIAFCVSLLLIFVAATSRLISSCILEIFGTFFDIGMLYLLLCGLVPWEASETTTNAATTDLAMTATSSTTISTDTDMGAHEVREDFF